MTKHSLSSTLIFTSMLIFSSSSHAVFVYDLAEYSQFNGSNTFTDTFSDGLEPPSGPISSSDYNVTGGSFEATRENGDILELNSADTGAVPDGDQLIGAIVIDPNYYFTSGAGGYIKGAFEVNNGFFSNTVFGIDIDNFESGLLTPIILEDAVAGIYSDSSGNINAVWGDNSAINQLDITADVIGVNQFTLLLEMDVLNQVSVCFDYRSDGSCDLVIDNFKTMTFTPSNPNDLFSGGFVAIDNFSIVPVPAAVWLFGSGLLGLIGLARRKKS